MPAFDQHTEYDISRISKQARVIGSKHESLLLKLLKVTKHDAEKADIRIIESKPEDDLLMLHYLNLTPKTSHVRGVIVDTAEKKVISINFPFPTDIEADLLKKNPLPVSEDSVIIMKAYEGIVLRLFQGQKTKRWYISTHSRLDGTKSKWSADFFGKQFEEVWGGELSETSERYKVDSDVSYTFLLAHNDNRLVCKVIEPKLYLLSTFKFTDDPEYLPLPPTFKGYNPFMDNSRIITQTQLLVKETSELHELAQQMRWEDCCGLFIFVKSESVKCYRAICSDYTKLRKIRGDEPNLKLRYLQLKKGEDGELFESDIRDFFPESLALFDEVDSEIKEACTFMANLDFKKCTKDPPKEVKFPLNAARRFYQPELSFEENISIQFEKSNARQTNAVIKYMKNYKKQEAYFERKRKEEEERVSE